MFDAVAYEEFNSAWFKAKETENDEVSKRVIN